CFGRGPSGWVVRHAMDAGPEPMALDIGCGLGRNAVYLARRGFRVDALDVAPEAIRRLRQAAAAEDLPVTARLEDARNWRPDGRVYDVVLAVTVLSLLGEEDLRALCRRIERALVPGGLLLVEDFASDDPGRLAAAQASEFAPLVRHYFAPAELGGLFPGLQVVARDRIRVRDRTHGTPHRHSLVRFAARRA
ncbi:MAG: class I SAM-dependent methyltransferase, partial [Candidatus Brocadiia bacterium]